MLRNETCGRLLASLGVATILITSCGSDDSDDRADGDGDPPSVQDLAADEAVEAGELAGIDLDRACVDDLVGQMSDSDAQALVDAGADGTPELSEEGDALTARLLGCAPDDAIIDVFVTQIENEGQDVDEECVRERLEGVDLSGALDDPTQEPPSELIDALLACSDLGDG